MQKQSLKMALHLLVCILICFLCIYLFVFFGGWRLFESGDPILIEIAVAIGAGLILWIIYEQSKFYEKKITELERRVSELEREGNQHG